MTFCPAVPKASRIALDTALKSFLQRRSDQAWDCISAGNFSKDGWSLIPCVLSSHLLLVLHLCMLQTRVTSTGGIVAGLCTSQPGLLRRWRHHLNAMKRTENALEGLPAASLQQGLVIALFAFPAFRCTVGRGTAHNQC